MNAVALRLIEEPKDSISRLEFKTEFLWRILHILSLLFVKKAGTSFFWKRLFLSFLYPHVRHVCMPGTYGKQSVLFPHLLGVVIKVL